MQIIVADDYFVVLSSIRTLFEQEGESYRIAGEAHNGRGLLALLGARSCDLVITDFCMPDSTSPMDGLVLLGELHARHPSLPVIILTMTSYPPLIRKMFDCGVRGIVNKRAMNHELLVAIRAVASGQSYLSTQLEADALRRIERQTAGDTHAADALGALSVREVEILRLHLQGLSFKEIGAEVHRSATTVSQQLSGAMQKLGLLDNSQLREYAKAYGLTC